MWTSTKKPAHLLPNSGSRGRLISTLNTLSASRSDTSIKRQMGRSPGDKLILQIFQFAITRSSSDLKSFKLKHDQVY